MIRPSCESNKSLPRFCFLEKTTTSQQVLEVTAIINDLKKQKIMSPYQTRFIFKSENLSNTK